MNTSFGRWLTHKKSGKFSALGTQVRQARFETAPSYLQKLRYIHGYEDVENLAHKT